jgi:hypothetical protein
MNYKIRRVTYLCNLLIISTVLTNKLSGFNVNTIHNRLFL